MSFKLHLILACKPLVFMQIRCNFPENSYLSETQKNNFQFLRNEHVDASHVNFRWFICVNVQSQESLCCSHTHTVKPV